MIANVGKIKASERVSRIYLDELQENPESITLSLVQLVVTPENTAINQAKELVTRSKQEIKDKLIQRQIWDLVETVIV